MSMHQTRTRTLLLTWGGLLCLTLLTSLLGLVDLGGLSLPVAVLIASTKAALIGLFFMEVLFDSKLVRVSAAVGIFWLLILITITLSDYLTRGWLLPSGK